MAGEADQFTADDGSRPVNVVGGEFVRAGLSAQEIRESALEEACRCYQGLTVIRGGREDAILGAAQRFAKFIDTGETL